MSGIKCPECGLVNFSAAGECKRCHVRFHHPEPIPDTSSTLREVPARESADEEQEYAPLPPLDDYFTAEPAKFSVPVILFAVGLSLNWLAVAFQLAAYVSFMNSSTWDVMTDPGGIGWLYNPILEPLVHMELIAHLVVVIAVPVLLTLLWRKSWSFTKLVPVYLVAELIYQGVQIVALLSLRAYLPGKETLKPFDMLLTTEFWIGYALLAFFSVALTLIWLTYFDRSEKVKRIFIN